LWLRWLFRWLRAWLSPSHRPCLKFKSPFISRRFSFQLQGEEIATEQTDRFLVRLPLAVYSLPRDDVSIEK
jgi:hypothetical protein